METEMGAVSTWFFEIAGLDEPRRNAVLASFGHRAKLALVDDLCREDEKQKYTFEYGIRSKKL